MSRFGVVETLTVLGSLAMSALGLAVLLRALAQASRSSRFSVLGTLLGMLLPLIGGVLYAILVPLRFNLVLALGVFAGSAALGVAAGFVARLERADSGLKVRRASLPAVIWGFVALAAALITQLVSALSTDVTLQLLLPALGLIVSWAGAGLAFGTGLNLLLRRSMLERSG